MITSVCFTEAAAPEEGALSFSKGDAKMADTDSGKADDFLQLISQKAAGTKPQLPDQKPEPPIQALPPDSPDQDSNSGPESVKISNCNDIVIGLLADEPVEEVVDAVPATVPKADLEAISQSVVEALVAIFAPQPNPQPNQELSPSIPMEPAAPQSDSGAEAGGIELGSIAQTVETDTLTTPLLASASPKQADFSVPKGKDMPAGQNQTKQTEKIASPNPVPTLPDVAPVSDDKSIPAPDFVATPELTESLKTEASDGFQPPATPRSKSLPERGAGNRISHGGTGVALKSLDMNLTVEKNEIAGPEEQNLPLWHRTARFSVDLAKKGDAKGVPALLPDKKEAIGQSLLSSLSEHVKIHPVASVPGVPEVESAGVVTQVSQTERISTLLTREVVMIKKLGADSLAVSLKVDHNTQIFLRLNHREGQVHAFVSCERDTMPVLEKHWQQLQESLARQNVQLMPLNEKFSSVTPDSNSASNSNQSKQFEQPAQRDPQSRRELPEQPVPALKPAGSAPRSAAAKSRVLMPLGWETYA